MCTEELEKSQISSATSSFNLSLSSSSSITSSPPTHPLCISSNNKRINAELNELSISIIKHLEEESNVRILKFVGEFVVDEASNVSLILFSFNGIIHLINFVLD